MTTRHDVLRSFWLATTSIRMSSCAARLAWRSHSLDLDFGKAAASGHAVLLLNVGWIGLMAARFGGAQEHKADLSSLICK